MPGLTLKSIHRFPVKSLLGEDLDISYMGPLGVSGDRSLMIVDLSGKFKTARNTPKLLQLKAQLIEEGLLLSLKDGDSLFFPLPTNDDVTKPVTVWHDTVDARPVDQRANKFLSHILEEPVELVQMAKSSYRQINPDYSSYGQFVSFADGFPVLLTSTSSLADLNGNLENSVSMNRFRPNITIDGGAPWEENTWKVIKIGDVSFHVVKPCSRCIVTTYDPDTGTRPDPKEPLNTLARLHRSDKGEVIFGQNIIPLNAGIVRAGMSVEIVAAGESNVSAPPKQAMNSR